MIIPKHLQLFISVSWYKRASPPAPSFILRTPATSGLTRRPGSSSNPILRGGPGIAEKIDFSFGSGEKDSLILRTKNCIDCHMPLQTSKTITVNTGAGLTDIPYLIRTHRIGIYK